MLTCSTRFKIFGFVAATLFCSNLAGSSNLAISYLDSSYFYLNKDLSIAEHFAKKGRAILSQSTNDSAKCAFEILESKIKMNKGEFLLAAKHLDFFNESGCAAQNTENKLQYHSLRAYLCRVRSEYTNAIQHYEKILKLTKDHKNKEATVNTYAGIGSSYLRLEDIEKALKNFSKAKNIVNEVGIFDSVIVANLYLSSGALYIEYGLFEEGLIDIEIAEKLQPNSPRHKIYVHKNKAIMYTGLDSLELAEEHYLKMIKACENNNFMIADAKLGLAELSIKNYGFGKVEEKLLTEAFSEFARYDAKKDQALIAYTLSDQYLSNKDLTSATTWIETHNDLTQALDISKFRIKDNFLKLRLSSLESGSSTREIDELALYADSLQLIYENEKLKKLELSSRITNQRQIEQPTSVNNKYLYSFLVALAGLSLFLFMNAQKYKKENSYSQKKIQESKIATQALHQLETEKQKLEKLHIIEKEQKAQLEEQNKKLENDIASINARQSKSDEKLVIKTKGKLNYVPIKTLMYVQAEENGCRYYMQDGSSLWNDEKLKTWEENLNPTQFVRIHRSTLVQKEYITKVSYDKLSLQDGTELKIGRKYKQNL